MDECLYEPAECDSERTVIISELQGGENDPEQLLDMEVTATAFKVHPYRHPTIGWLSDLETMTREDLFGHYRRYYVPSNATLVIVGDVDTDDALATRRSGSSAASPAGRRPSGGPARSPRSRRNAGSRCARKARPPISRRRITRRRSTTRRSFRCWSPTPC